MPAAGQPPDVARQRRAAAEVVATASTGGFQHQNLRLRRKAGRSGEAAQPAWCNDRMLPAAGGEGREEGGGGTRSPNERTLPVSRKGERRVLDDCMPYGVGVRVRACRWWASGTIGTSNISYSLNAEQRARNAWRRRGKAEREGRKDLGGRGRATLYMSRRAGTGRRTRSGTWKPFSGFHLTGSCARLL